MKNIKWGRIMPRSLCFILSIILCLATIMPLPVNAAAEAMVNAASLTLDGKIGVNFYINTDGLGTGDSYILLNGEKQYIKNATKTKSGTLFTYYVNAKEMHDMITLTAHTADGTKAILRNSAGTAYADNTMTYSVADYVSSVRNMADASLYLKTLASDMMSYGEFSQLYFGYKADGIRPSLQSLDYAEAVKVFAKNTSGALPDGVDYVGSSLLLTSAIGIRHYFTIAGPIPKFMVNGEPVSPAQSGSSYYVDIENIPVSMFGTAYTLMVEDSKGWTLDFSVLSYAEQVLSTGDSNDELQNLCKAMYSYYASAKAYFEQPGPGAEEDNTPSAEYPSFHDEETDLIDAMFKVPYISTYYFNAKPYTDEDVIMPVYVTDYEQSEYLKNDTTKTLDILIEIDGSPQTVSNVPLGDYTLNLGKLTEGEHVITVQSMDKTTGLKSHKLYNDFLVVDRQTYENPKTYIITDEDLAAYGISKDDSDDPDDLIHTRDGLTRLFADLQAAEYRKCILPKGTYRVEGDQGRDKAVTIPSHFTVDLNESTIKLNPIYEEKASAIIRFDHAVDSCITNGTLEGDRFERQAVGLEEFVDNTVKGEPINTIVLFGSKYCTITDLTIKNTTGHTITNFDPPGNRAFTQMSQFTNVAIIDGEEVANEKCSTSGYIDLSYYLNYCPDRYIYTGHYNGYRGIKGESEIVYFSFYDANKNFMETVTGHQYRKMLIPEGAGYIRVTYAGKVPADGTLENQVNVYNKTFTEYLSITNIDFVDTRTCAIATTVTNNMLVEHVTFERCGNSITPSPVDFEDGWEESQDLYYRDVHVLERAPQQTATVIDNSGLNHVYENVTGHDMYIRGRVVGAVVRNVNDRNTTLTYSLGPKIWSGIVRIYDNKCGHIEFNTSERQGLRNANAKVKNCNIYVNTRTRQLTAPDPSRIIYEKCEFPSYWGQNATFVSCTMQPTSYLDDKLYFYDCTFKNMDGTGEEVRFAFNLNPFNRENNNIDRVFVDCKFPDKTCLANNNSFHSGIFKNCEFADLRMEPGIAPDKCEILFDHCDIKSGADRFINTRIIGNASGSYLNMTFRDCNLTHTGKDLVYFSNYCGGDSRIVFDNCTINKPQGYIVTGDKIASVADDESVSVDILFKNTKTSDRLVADPNIPANRIRVQ